MKTISFYNPNLPKDDIPINPENKSSNVKLTIFIVVIVVLSAVSVGLGIYLSRVCYKAKKAKGRLNEIKENFVYETQENNNGENESQSNAINVWILFLYYYELIF